MIEGVSPGSKLRDYEEKREEYLAFGVREYWTFDAKEREMLVLKRAGIGGNGSCVRPGSTGRACCRDYDSPVPRSFRPLMQREVE